MDENVYINLNGNIICQKDASFGVQDLIFTTNVIYQRIRASGTNIFLLSAHYENISAQLERFKIAFEKKISFVFFKQQITRLIHKNRYYTSSLIHFYFYPENKDGYFIIKIQKIPEESFKLNRLGYHIDIYNEYQKIAENPLATETYNTCIDNIAHKYKTQKKLDECILLNNYNRISDTIHSTIYLISSKKLLTPLLSEGGKNDVIRKVVLSAAQQVGLTVKETKIKINTLQIAEEILLSNSTEGIRWVIAYRDRRYFKKNAEKILMIINKEFYGQT